MKLKGINRVELLVEDADAAQHTFDTLFNGLTFKGAEGSPGQPLDCRVNYSNGLELVHPRNSADKLGQLLKSQGEHIFTVVWDVESIDDAKLHLAAKGFEVQYEGDFSADPDVEVHRVIVVRPERTHGLLVTLQERRVKPGIAAVAPARSGVQVTGLQRAELLVADADAAEADFQALFHGALDFERDVESGSPIDCRVDWNMGLELVRPTSEEYKLGQLLKAKGQHVFTVVWDVDSLDAAKAHMAAHGFEVQWEGDFGAHGPFEVHKQLVVRPDRTHGLQVIFQERRMRATA